MKQAPFPVVGSAFGLALGGGCELLLHCDAIQAHAESYIGLVETGVGIIPGWGGCKELLLRWTEDTETPKGPMPAAQKAFKAIAMGCVSQSAFEARNLRFLRKGDGITMNRECLLADSKARVLALAKDYKPEGEVSVSLGGPSAMESLMLSIDMLDKQGRLAPHDHVIAKALARVLSGGDIEPTEPVSEDRILRLECEAVMELIQSPSSLARIKHMLENGKPLRN